MKTKLLSHVLMCIVCFMSTQVNAQVLFQETFDYTAGIYLVESGVATSATTGWSNFNDRDDYFYITEDSLLYPGYVFSGQGNGLWMSRENGQEVQKSFTQNITEGSFYFAYMVKPESGRSSGSVFIRLLDSSGNTESEFRAKRNDANTGIQFALDDSYSDVSCAYDQTHLLVYKYTFAGVDGAISDSVSLFINPSLSEEPVTPDLKNINSEGNSDGINAIRLRCRLEAMGGIIDGIIVASTWDDLKTSFASDNVDIESISADGATVSYEQLSFSLIGAEDDIYIAHDSIAYDNNEVTITASTTDPEATITYTKQVVNPTAGASDTAVWVVTGKDGTTTKTYKAVVARSEYNCKAGLLTGGGLDTKPEGWSTAGWNYASNSNGNGGLYPGDYIIRFTDKDDNDPGSLTTPKFSQVGTLAFSGKFSNSDYTESILVLTSTDDGTTWDTVATYQAIEGAGEIPSYTGESAEDSLNRVSLSINKQDVMIRFQYCQPGELDLDDAQRTAIDDIACKATDFVADGFVKNIETKELQENAFSIYPNPASENIHIVGDVSSISIYSLSGQLIREVKNTNIIDTSDLKTGIYLVKAGQSTQQLMIK